MSLFIQTYRNGLIFFIAVWLLAVICLAAYSYWAWVGRAAGLLFAMGLFCWLTVYLTKDESSQETEDEDDRKETDSLRRLSFQLIAALILALLATIRFYEIPIWKPFYQQLHNIGSALPLPYVTYFTNPVLYIVLPGLAMWALGAKWKELGFQSGWKSWSITALWSVIAVLFWIYLLVVGQTSVPHIFRALISNTFQNGFGEEFLFRGVIQTRIGKLLGRGWGLSLASLAFGLWHLDAIYFGMLGMQPDNIWIAASLSIVIQAPVGLGFGLIFYRTRNLLAPSLIHIVLNSMDV